MREVTFVTGMPQTSVTEDGNFAIMELINSDGTTQVLRFSPSMMLDFVSKVFQLFVNQRIQTARGSGHFESQPIPALNSVAQSADGSKSVILGIQMQNGLQVVFSIQPTEAEELHRQLGKAVKKSRRNLN